jgi:DNA-binding response OmpR family regulator
VKTQSGTVLIVDDNRSAREMLAEYLTTHGYRAPQAGDGAAMRAGLERELAKPFDPRELLARLKSVLRRIQAGVRALLRKPVDPAALLQILTGCLPAAGTPVQRTTAP